MGLLVRCLALVATTAPLQFTVEFDGRSHTTEGDDAAAMARYYVDEIFGADFVGEGCATRACSVDLLERAILVANADEGLETPDSGFQLVAARDPGAPLLVLCASLGATMGPDAAESTLDARLASRMTMEFEFRRFVNRTFGDSVSVLFVRDGAREWYLGGVAGLGGDPAAAADGVRRLLDARGLRPNATLVAGSSMGGFGAILLGALLGADDVVAFVPQTFVDPAGLARAGDARFPHYAAVAALVAAGRAGAAYADLGGLVARERARGGPCATKYLLVSRLPGDGGDGGHAAMDAVHAAHLRRRSGCVDVVRCPAAAAHTTCAKVMRDTGALERALRDRAFAPPGRDRSPGPVSWRDLLLERAPPPS